MSICRRALSSSWPRVKLQASYASSRNFKAIPRDVPYGSSIHKQVKKDKFFTRVPEEADAVVVGGGSVGCSVAYHLSKLMGSGVILLESNSITSGTTWHSAGILWSYRPSESETVMQLQTRDLISNILPEETGDEAGWLKTGAIHVAKSEEQFNDFKQVSTLAKALGAEVTEVDGKDISDIHPLLNINDVYGAVYSPGDGTMDPATYCMSCVKAAIKHGAKIIEHCPVTDVLTHTDDLGYRRVSGVMTERGKIKTKLVINCAGAWAAYIGKMAGVRIPQLTYKHAYVVTDPIPGIRGTPVVKDHGTVYIKPQGEALQYGGYEMNPHLVNDLPRDFSFGLYDLDWEIFEQHYTAAINRLPAIEKSGIRSTVCGPESFTPDGRPNIGECPEVRGFFVGSAFNSGGMMLGGGAGRQLAHWVYHGKPEIDMFNCDIRRYQTSFTDYNKWLHEACHDKFHKRLGMIYAHDHNLGGRNQRTGPLHQVHRNSGALFGCRNGFERPAYFVIDGKGKPRTDLDVLPYNYYGYYDNKIHDSYPYYDAVVKDCTFGFPEQSHKLIGRECLKCRSSSVLFDLSYMSKYTLTGRDVDAAVKLLFTRDVTASRPGQFVYTMLLNCDAGIEGDVLVTKLNNCNDETSYYVTAPSSGEQYFLSHMEKVICDAGFKCHVDDVTGGKAIISVQGPDSKTLLQTVIKDPTIFELKYGRWMSIRIAGKEAMLARLSFVGELGYEIHCDADDATTIYDVIMRSSGDQEPSLAGYRALESLSTEAGFHHWPHSITSVDNPVEAGLIRFCDDSDDYIGSTSLRRLRAEPTQKRLVFFTVNCDVPMHGGEVIWRDGEIVGHLRTADFSYVLNSTVGCGYVKTNQSMSSLGDDVISEGSYVIERMGFRYAAQVHTGSLFASASERMRGNYKARDLQHIRGMLDRL